MSIEYLKYFVKKIHSNCPAAGINDPVLTYTGIFIVVKFTNVIIGGVSGRDNFDDKIRCTVTAFSVKFFGSQITIRSGWTIVPEREKSGT